MYTPFLQIHRKNSSQDVTRFLINSFISDTTFAVVKFFFFMYKILFIIIILKLKVLFLKSVQCPILKKKIHNGAVHYLQVERESTSQLSDELEYFQTGLLPNYLFGNYVYVHIKSRTPSCIYCLLSFWNRTDIYCIHS